MPTELRTVRRLLREGNYAEARAEMLTIDHPNAPVWIRAVDNIIRAQGGLDKSRSRRPRPAPKLHNPQPFLLRTLLFTPYVTAYHLSRNWGGLLKPQWILPSLLFCAVTLLSSSLASLYALHTVMSNPLNSASYGMIALTLSGILYGFLLVAGMIHLQKHAYDEWQASRQDPLVLLEQPYQVGKVVMQYGVALVVMVTSLTIFTRAYMLPNWFITRNEIALEYPMSWVRRNPFEVPFCRFDNSCVLYLTDEPLDQWTLGVVVMRSNYDLETTIVNYRDELETRAYVNNVTLETAHILDGKPTYILGWEEPSATVIYDNRIYYAASGNYIYELYFFARQSEAYEEHQDAIYEMIRTVQLY